MEPKLPRAQTIFGREPVMILGLIETVLVSLMTFGLGVNQETFGPIMAAVTAAVGLYTAWATTETRLAAIVGFFKSALVLAAVFGLTLDDQQTGVVITVVTTVASFILRDRTSPMPQPELPVEAVPATETLYTSATQVTNYPSVGVDPETGYGP